VLRKISLGLKIMENVHMKDKFRYLRKSTENSNRPVIADRSSVVAFKDRSNHCFFPYSRKCLYGNTRIKNKFQ
jgi:hypothetical protein